jgi:hypothetical protein
MLERKPVIGLAAGQLTNLLEAAVVDQPGDALADGEATLAVLSISNLPGLKRLPSW